MEALLVSVAVKQLSVKHEHLEPLYCVLDFDVRCEDANSCCRAENNY